MSATSKADSETDREDQENAVPDLRPEDVKAIAVGDCHFSDQPPGSRGESAGSPWYSKQRQVIEKVLSIVDRYSTDDREIPLILPGDVFDKSDNSARLTNFLIDCFGRHRNIYVVPGNHDLPNHDLSRLGESSLGTMIRAKVFQLLTPEGTYNEESDLTLYGLGYGEIPTAINRNKVNSEDILVWHRFVWVGERDAGNPEYSSANNYQSVCRDIGHLAFDKVVTGDNHQTFIARTDDERKIINPGRLMSRTIKERKWDAPVVAVIGKRGVHRIESLRVPELWRADLEEMAESNNPVDQLLVEFWKALEEVGDTDINYEAAVRAAIKSGNASKAVRKLILSFIEDHKK